MSRYGISPDSAADSGSEKYFSGFSSECDSCCAERAVDKDRNRTMGRKHPLILVVFIGVDWF
jgi:hypothetical protein